VVDYETALDKEGKEFTEEFVEVCDLTKGGICNT